MVLKARFTIDRRSFYYPLGSSYTKVDFSEICNVQKSKSAKYEEKKVWLDYIEKYKKLLKNLKPGIELTLDDVRMVVEGRGVDAEDTNSFIGIWEEMIDRLKTENNGARYTTAEFYENALKSFRKILWRHPIEGFKITIDDLKKWNQGMQNGVKDKEGKLVGKISDTTRGIYLRTCRAVWNECKSRGYLTHLEYPFSNVKKDAIAIPKGATRKDEYLEIEKMTELYKVFINKSYPDTWKQGYAERAHYSLGIFLAQYLCNGFNLVDAALLKYTKYYFDTERKALKFHRKKTRGRSENASEVIIPIIEPLQRILDEIAAVPKLGAYVFPQLLNGAETEEEIRKRASQENSNVQDRIIKICEDVLHWEVRPSSTWARHSYGTNLALVGIEQRYISESMGHAISKSVTDLYIANYPLSKQMEYNNKLLDLQPKESEVDVDSMTEEELKAKLKELLAKK